MTATLTLTPSITRSVSLGSARLNAKPSAATQCSRQRQTRNNTTGQPTCLNSFYAKHPEFLVAPVALMLLLHQAYRWLGERHGLSMWGVGALQYVAFSLLLEFAFHGWLCTYEHQISSGKFQPAARFQHSPAGVATRQTAVLLSNVVYVFVPLRPSSTGWASFVGSLLAFAILWDAYFFAVHRAAHRHPKLYVRIHKLHHQVREPMCFAAYYVEYLSHFLTEQLVVFAASATFVPRDVLLCFLYLSLLDTFVQHSGVNLDHLRLPLLPALTVGHVRKSLSCYAHAFGGAMDTPHHDWHHEKNEKNYALCFTYLDKLAGTYHDGREAAAAH